MNIIKSIGEFFKILFNNKNSNSLNTPILEDFWFISPIEDDGEKVNIATGNNTFDIVPISTTTTKAVISTATSTYNHLIDWERTEKTVYNDGYGYLTIGIGHVIFDQKEMFDGKLLMKSTLTLEQMYRLCDQDLEKRLKCKEQLKSKIKYPLLQHEYDAIILFIFNTGSLWNDLASKINDYLINRDNKEILELLIKQWRKYINVSGKPTAGLINRREGELDIFLLRYKGRNYYQKPTGAYTLNNKIINPYY